MNLNEFILRSHKSESARDALAAVSRILLDAGEFGAHRLIIEHYQEIVGSVAPWPREEELDETILLGRKAS